MLRKGATRKTCRCATGSLSMAVITISIIEVITQIAESVDPSHKSAHLTENQIRVTRLLCPFNHDSNYRG